MKKKSMGKVVLPEIPRLSPYEWDFRIVPEVGLEKSIRYECARECSEFRGELVAWLEKIVDGHTVRSHLAHAHINGGDRQLHGRFNELIPQDLAFHAYLLGLGLLPCFPTPITWLIEHKAISFGRNEVSPCGSIGNHGIQIRPLNKDALHFQLEMANKFARWELGYELKVDLDRKVDEVLGEFERWLRAERKKRGVKSAKGKAAAPAWHHLKQLAAKRLSDAGLSWKQAQRHVEAQWTKNPCDHEGDVMPSYSSHGGWTDAVKAAKSMILEFEDKLR